MIRSNTIAVLLLALVSAFVPACGSSSSSTTASSTYKVEYLPGTGMNAPVQGKTTFQIRIMKQSDGSVASGLHPTLSFVMHMSPTDSHATPADTVKESSTPGTYDCTAYYLMGGTWEMTVTVGGETTTFNPNVGMVMAGSDTVRATLYGADDLVTGTTYNKYYLFRDGPVSAATPTLKLYISHGENMMMDFKAVSAGSVLSSGTITYMIVTASTDSTFPATPGVTVTGTDKGTGHWELPGLSSLSSSGIYPVYVKLEVNGEDKTTNGSAASGINSYATFTVTAGM